MSGEQCGAHNLLVAQVDRCQDDIDDLREKDRQKTEEIHELSEKMSEQLNEIKNTMTRMSGRQDITDSKIENILTEIKSQSEQQNNITKQLIDTINNFNTQENNIKKKEIDQKTKLKWKPENWIQLLAGFGGASGIAALIYDFINFISKHVH